MFWSHADEERSHAIQFIQYLRMRGAENNDFFGGNPIVPREQTYDWQGVDDVSLRTFLLADCLVEESKNNE